jgi:hypothetical protein
MVSMLGSWEWMIRLALANASMLDSRE